MNVVVVGSGAMGSLFAARLTAVTNVTMLGHWPAQLAAIRQHGLTVQEMDGTQRTIALAVTSQPNAAAPADLALVLVKSRQTARAAADCAALLKPEGTAVTLQNGLGNADTLAETLGADRVIQATTAQGATITAPGSVHHAGHGPTYLGHTPATEIATRQVATLLSRAGIPAEQTADVAGLVWGKLAVNAAINPLTALLALPNGALLKDAWTRAVMDAAAAEVTAVAYALGVTLPFADAAAQAAAVARATAANRSSMLQDLSRGAPTEIDAICGAIIAHGQRQNVPTPVNGRLYTLIRQRENGQPVTSDEVQTQLMPFIKRPSSPNNPPVSNPQSPLSRSSP